jgi:Ca2+-binding EF-hand superfamily protein
VAPVPDASPEPALPAISEAKDQSSSGIEVRAFSKDAEERLVEIFKKCDPQENGTINKRELIKIVRKEPMVAEFFGMPSDGEGSRERIEGLFQAIDADQDREITFDELHLFYQSYVTKKKAPAPDPEEEEEFLDIQPPTHGHEEEVESSEAAVLKKQEGGTPLVMVFMTKHDGRPKAGAAALHLARNEDDQDPEALISENPSFHNIVSCSGPPGREYSTSSEVGTVLKLTDEAQQVCPLMMVPSLKTSRGQGKFTITVMSTRELIVERLQ